MNESQIKEWFGQYLKIKDATIIRNKQTGQANEIALIEFFTSEDADYALRMIETPNFMINGHPVSGTITKLKKDDLENESNLPFTTHNNMVQAQRNSNYYTNDQSKTKDQ